MSEGGVELWATCKGCYGSLHHMSWWDGKTASDGRVWCHVGSFPTGCIEEPKPGSVYKKVYIK